MLDKIKKNNVKIFNMLINIVIMIILLTMATLIGFIFSKVEILETNIVIIYILFVFFISVFTKNYVYGIIGSILSIFLYNFFFTIPYYTFRLYNYGYIVTFAVMVITSTITSMLTMKLQKVAIVAKEKEKESSALYQLSNRLADAESIDDIAGFAVKIVSDSFGCLANCICFDDNNNPEKFYIQQKNENEQVRISLDDCEELKKRMNNLLLDHDEDSEYFNYPIRNNKKIFCVLRIPYDKAKYLSEYQKRLLHSIIESTSIAMERFILSQEEARIRTNAEQEKYRSNLLRSISHDLRTPLSGIIGTSEILMDISKDDEKKFNLSKEINESAEWLHSLVENILNLTRIQEGRLTMNKTIESIEDIIGVSVSIIEKRYNNRLIEVQLSEKPLFVEIDAKLINQVLVNLLDNAVKHTKENETIGIKILEDNSNIQVIVYDEGTGISNDDLPNIFQSFYTTSKESADKEKGVGLGLAICESVIKAHNGTITAKNRNKKGAEFIITLPIKGENNE